MAQTGKKSNKAFMILSALGILFVIDCHCWNPVGLFTAIFPYDSFFMPMFVFISGYFFSERHLSDLKSTGLYILDKFRKLFLPYLGWAVLYGIFTWMGAKTGLFHWSPRTFADLPLNIFTNGATFNVNGAAWFVPLLFFVIAVYTVIRKIFGRFWNDIAAFAVFAAVGAVCVYLSAEGYSSDDRFLLLLKTGFFIQFFELGQVFRRYIEPVFDKLPTLAVCGVCAVINIVLIRVFGDITFVKCATMSGFLHGNVPVLPLVTSLTGIFFWLKLAKLAEPALGNSKIVNFISDNTFFIMEHHLLAKGVFYSFVFACKALGSELFAAFDTDKFRNDPWYVFAPDPAMKAAAFLATAAITVAACFLYNKLKEAAAGKLAPRKGHE